MTRTIDALPMQFRWNIVFTALPGDDAVLHHAYARFCVVLAACRCFLSRPIDSRCKHKRWKSTSELSIPDDWPILGDDRPISARRSSHAIASHGTRRRVDSPRFDRFNLVDLKRSTSFGKGIDEAKEGDYEESWIIKRLLLTTEMELFCSSGRVTFLSLERLLREDAFLRVEISFQWLIVFKYLWWLTGGEFIFLLKRIWLKRKKEWKTRNLGGKFFYTLCKLQMRVSQVSSRPS